MTGYQSKKAMARDKLLELAQEGMSMHSHDAPEYIVCQALIEALAQPDTITKALLDMHRQDLAAWAKAVWEARADKEALAQPAQEPVAWWVTSPNGELDWGDEPIRYKEQRPLEELLDGCGYAPLYTTPPQRPWVDLTDSDWKEIEDMPDTFDQGVAWAQAKLKEKNNG